MQGLAVYVKERLPFAGDLSVEKSAYSYLCFRLALLHSVCYFFFLYRSPSSSFCTVFDSISSNIDEILSINPSAIFLSLEILASIIRTGLSILVELIDLVNSVIIFPIILNNLTQMFNFPTRIPGSDSHTPALLNFFLSSDASICSTIAFLLLGNSDHVVVSVSIDFPSNSQRGAPFHCIAYDYSRADWNGLHDHLRDVRWKDIFKLGASTAASEFCEQVQVGNYVYILHRKCKVKPH